MCDKVVPTCTYRKTHVLTSSLEALTINISALNTTCVFVTDIYRRPACHSTHVIQSLSHILSHVSHPSPHIVLDDITDDLLSPSTNKPVQPFMTAVGFTQILQGPTIVHY